MLLRIAAGDDEAELQAAALTGRSRDVVRRAATFFIEQILLAPCTDSYRILGASPQAGAGELRRNFALLTKWLHPDRNAPNDRSIFIDKVTAAWNDLKTPERRAVYDKAQPAAMNGSKSPAESPAKLRKNGPAEHGNGTVPAMMARHRAAAGRPARNPRRGSGAGLLRLVLSALLRRPLL
jgi:curved DNA-binding protein CbpA